MDTTKKYGTKIRLGGLKIGYLMQFIYFLFLCSFSYSFAQIDPMEYFYKGRSKETLPDFAALAVFESQSCPLSFPIDKKDAEFDKKVYKYWDTQICTSRYKIIHILDVASDTLRKEYLEVKEKPIHTYFRYRPMLIFGKYKDGMIQIEKYEEVREYFDPFNSNEAQIHNQQIIRFGDIPGFLGEIYAFHAIGTPYYNSKKLDSIDVTFYNEVLLPKFKLNIMASGKDFNKLWQRLTKKRTPVKIARIKNDFAALGVIKKVHFVNNSKQANFYELSVVMETIFKNDAKIDSNITIFIDKKHLPLGWSCLPLSSLDKMPFYLFGDLKDGNLVIESLASTLDMFVFGDTIYDISMGLPFRDLIAYFLPQNISIEELEFYGNWRIFEDSFTLFEEIPEELAFAPKCLVNDIKEAAVKQYNFEDKQLKFQKEAKFEEPFLGVLPLLGAVNEFRCRKYVLLPMEGCNESNLNGKGVWGKW